MSLDNLFQKGLLEKSKRVSIRLMLLTIYNNSDFELMENVNPLSPEELADLYQNGLFSPIIFNRQEFLSRLKEELGETTLHKLEQVEGILQELYLYKDFPKAISLLKESLNKYEEQIEFEIKNPIIITSDYEILLTDFSNFKIQFPDLTQAVYILFCKHPKGIDINELNAYYDELLEIYMQISPKADLNQIEKSIKDLVNIENKQIHTHISRIKSNLNDILGEAIAKHYVISSAFHGSSFKFIPILKE